MAIIMRYISKATIRFSYNSTREVYGMIAVYAPTDYFIYEEVTSGNDDEYELDDDDLDDDD